MAHVAVLGEVSRVSAWALAGAALLPAEDPDQVRAAWAGLPPDVAVVLLTPAAATALADALCEPVGPMTVVLP